MAATTLADGVRFNATSSGSGDFVDASAVTGYRRASGILVDGQTYRYRAENASLSEYERGSGVWTSSSSTLARTTIEYSSTGSKVSFTTAPEVSITPGPDDIGDMRKADNLSGLANVATARTNLGATTVGSALFTAADAAAARSVIGAESSGGGRGLFYKTDYKTVAFTRTGNGTISLKAGTVIELAGVIYQFSTDTAVQMPTLTAGTDYAIYLCNDGTLRADASFTAATGFSASTCRQIGGFHYAPGGNATAQAGGDATPQINPYSLWDLKFRPACTDPRGMTLIAGSFWCDIYLCGVDHQLNGTSKYNVAIADGSSPPKIPASFGGNGSSVYDTFNWWAASEVMLDHGKDLLSYAEFAAAAFGSTEASTSGTDPVSTILRQAYTSKWGVMLATGNMWVWGRDASYWPGANGVGWKDQTGGRGRLYLANDSGVVYAIFGGRWGETAANCGSRASYGVSVPWNSGGDVGARGRCDHLCHV